LYFVLSNLGAYPVRIVGEKPDRMYTNLHVDSGDSIVETIPNNGLRKHSKSLTISALP
ncbi:hypothetical protein PIB30_103922, partial [Stylosanthes scabra]|nr:hypothetical protein [Stylosanthes scabra]